jgi:DNA-binding NtrC family response regulator
MRGHAPKTSAPLPGSPAAAVPPGARAGHPAPRRRLLVIGSLADVVEGGDLDDVDIDAVPWSAVSTALLTREGVDLCVPIVEAFDEASAAFFEQLAIEGGRSPVLAVLPAQHFDSPQFRQAAAAADDFVLRPVRFEEWRERVQRLAGPRCAEDAASGRLATVMGLLQLVGRSPGFLEVVRKVPLVARSGSPALVTGETGTGKELCARAIHFTSPRRSQPFIPVDCGAIPDNLFENELFGHVRGAFTDAHRDQRGLIALAEGGTLFLDEIDSLSPPAQAKLLRFLQDRTYRPLGSDRFLRANVNVLAAMNRDPEALVRDRLFRADLFFRLNVMRLHLAPLRERLSDVPLLAHHIIASCASEAGLPAKVLSPSAIPKLMAYDWPGNVRELANVLQRAVVLAPDRQIRPEHVALPAVEPRGGAAEPVVIDDVEAVSFRRGRAQVIAAFERGYVTRLLEKHGGNVTQAAREAQKDRRAFGRLLKKHGLRSGAVD